MTANLKISDNKQRQIRRFGITIGAVLTAIGGILLWYGKPSWPYIFALAGLFIICGLLFPRLLWPIEWFWMRLSGIIGIVMTHLILTLVYYLAITPTGLLRQIFGKDPLKMKLDKGAASYWIPVDPDGPTGRPEKPY